MSKQARNNTGTNGKLMRSLYQRQRTFGRSPDNKSLGKEEEKEQKNRKVIFRPSLPKAEAFNKGLVNGVNRMTSPKTMRSSISTHDPPLKVYGELPSKSHEKAQRDNVYVNRYRSRPSGDRDKKCNTSPRSIGSIHDSPKGEQQTQVVSRKEVILSRKEGNSYNVKAFLTGEEYTKFGQRFPQKFKRIGLLGRGGFSLVWLAVHRASKKRVAVKQILSRNPHETHLKEIWFCSYFFEKGGEPREQFRESIGIGNICRLYSFQIQKQDSWLYYEICDQSLSSSLFSLKGQSANGQRIYRIDYGELLYCMKKDQSQLKKVVVQVAKALTLINSHNIVHSDLKTDNIMLKTGKTHSSQSVGYIREVKLIDFGSSFLFTNLRQFSMATPEYMPPQILNYILFQNSMQYDKQMLQKMSDYKHPWTIDIWSLGCILLEIVSGLPLWMSVKTRLPSQRVAMGLFAIKNRVFMKIIQKQIEVVENLDYHLTENNHSEIVLNDELKMALRAMLCLQPAKRISPWELLTLLGTKCESPVIPAF